MLKNFGIDIVELDDEGTDSQESEIGQMVEVLSDSEDVP